MKLRNVRCQEPVIAPIIVGIEPLYEESLQRSYRVEELGCSSSSPEQVKLVSSI
jgi:hypothetical protein